MPVQIQCGECQKGLKVPDAARGKVLKCPGCGAKVKVPGNAEPEAAPKKKAKKEEAPPDSGEIIANLDLRKVADDDVEVCPQCGAEVYEDDEECGSCGFELQFGSVREAKRAALEGRKTDLTPFFQKMAGDAWAFSKAHMGFILSTWGINLFSACMVILCGHLAYWCATWPTQYFWSFFGVICAMVPIGWIWHFSTHIIRLTARKKKKIDKFHYDFAHSSMAGLIAVTWFFVFSLPLLLTLGLAGLYFTLYGDIPWALPAAIGGIFLLISPMFPQVMSHQAMPITYRGWLMPEIFKTFGISLKPALYWWVIACMTYLLPLLIMGAVLFFSQNSLVDYKKNLDDYANLHGATVRESLKEKKDKDDPEKKNPLDEEYLQLKPEPFKWTALLLPMTGVVISSFLVSFASVYNARSMGTYTYYLKNDLNLIQHVKEKVYVKKEENVLEFSMKRSLPCPNGARIIAYLIDASILIVIAVIMLVLFIFIGFQLNITDETQIMIGQLILSLINTIIYYGYFISSYTSPTRASPGKAAMNVYVCNSEGGEITFGQAFLRTFVFYILGVGLLPALINWIVLLTREDHRGWHDMAAGTYVRQRKKPKVKKKSEDEEEEKK